MSLKATTKVNSEFLDEEMSNLFNFTLKDNASNGVIIIWEIIQIVDS
jgi:hypothetical protein